MAKELPKNWVEVNLEDAVDILDNRRKPVSAKERSKRPGDIPYYGATGIAGYIDDYLFNENLILLGEDGAPFLEKNKNVAYMISGKSWVNNHAHVLRGKKGIISNKILLHFLNQFDYTGFVGGTTRLKLNQRSLKVIPFPLPPVAEQKRIVAKLDILFERLDKIKISLEKIPVLLKNFRQQVLTQAVTGKLTENINENSSVRLDSPITIDKTDSESPKNWKWIKLTELAKLESGHTPRKSKPEYWENGNIPWISLQDIRNAHGKIISETKYMTNSKGIKNSSARLLPQGTVCFSRDISVGFTTIMGREMSTTQHFANWICQDDKLLNIYLLYSFMAAKNYLTSSGQGTTVKTIYMPALKKLHLLLPPIQEQKEIVRRVENLLAKADKIQERYELLEAKIKHLPLAILHKAFKGELVAQLESDDDARDLLKEIEDLKKSVGSKPKKGKTRKYKIKEEELLEAAEGKANYKTK